MLVFWMQPGFALCEAGFTRGKNTANILMKNFVDFMLGSLLFFFIGFGFMFGSDGAGFVGLPNWGDLSFYKVLQGRPARRGLPDFRDGVLCNLGNHCQRCYGRAH